VIQEAAPADPLRSLLEAALGTHYEIVRELGKGGMGSVFLAHEKGLDRDVAIKVLPPDRSASEFYRDRFRLEARAAARLNHANIVPLHTFGEHDGMLYYVMGYVEGESLAQRLEREGYIEEAESTRILAALADALHYAHGRGVLHRDVKPQNILIESGSNRPLLTDFGISKIAVEGVQMTSTGMILGTPAYMSPEQAAGSPDVDRRSDLYSLGLVAYAMLSGRLPFEGRTPGELISRRLVSDAPRLVSRDGSAGTALIDTIMKCLARDPRERWADCDVFGRALQSEEQIETGRFDSTGVLALALGYLGVVAYASWRYAATPSIALELFGKIAPTIAGLIALLSIGGAVHLRWRGYTGGQVLQRIFLEPETWTGWYPARFRRPGNVWRRLPRAVRSLRAAFTVAAVGGSLLLGPVAFSVLAEPSPALRRLFGVLIAVYFLSTFGPFLLFAFLIPLRLRQRGLSQREAGGVAYSAPLAQKTFWSRPAVAAILDSQARVNTPASASEETRTVRTP